MNPKLSFSISAGLVGCMFVHAAEGLAHGKAASEVHLITSAPLVAVSSAASAMTTDFVQHNAITEAVHHASVPRESELRRGGLITVLS
jgi:hypothetical protein